MRKSPIDDLRTQSKKIFRDGFFFTKLVEGSSSVVLKDLFWWRHEFCNFFLASSFFGVPHPPSKSDDGRASLHTFAWEYFDSYLRVFECFWTSSFRPGPIKLLQNANNATQHGVSDNKKQAYSNSLACWASSHKLVKLQHLLTITPINQIATSVHCGVLLSNCQPF